MIARAVLIALLIGLTGCSTVPVYQRSRLARRCMRIDPNPQATEMEQHLYEYREGASGATGTTGGGCGCN
jgi:hypothetical protein